MIYILLVISKDILKQIYDQRSILCITVRVFKFPPFLCSQITTPFPYSMRKQGCNFSQLWNPYTFILSRISFLILKLFCQLSILPFLIKTPLKYSISRKPSLFNDPLFLMNWSDTKRSLREVVNHLITKLIGIILNIRREDKRWNHRTFQTRFQHNLSLSIKLGFKNTELGLT